MAEVGRNLGKTVDDFARHAFHYRYAKTQCKIRPNCSDDSKKAKNREQIRQLERKFV